jgi:hypothetical protein
MNEQPSTKKITISAAPLSGDGYHVTTKKIKVSGNYERPMEVVEDWFFNKAKMYCYLAENDLLPK